MREALALGSTYIGPEHLLLAILAAPTPRVEDALAAAHTDAKTVRAQAQLLASDSRGWDHTTLHAAAALTQRFAGYRRP